MRPLLAAVLVLFAATASRAADGFIVPNVAVDATGNDAIDAKNKAIADGQAEAFKRLATQLTTGTNVPAPAASALDRAVEGFEVADEKIAANRYRAAITYTFNRDAVQRLLSATTAASTAAIPASGEHAAAAPGATPETSAGTSILIPIASITDWVNARRVLQATPGISGITLAAFSNAQADVLVNTSLSMPRIATALTNKGYSLSQEDGYWVLRAGGR